LGKEGRLLARQHNQRELHKGLKIKLKKGSVGPLGENFQGLKSGGLKKLVGGAVGNYNKRRAQPSRLAGSEQQDEGHRRYQQPDITQKKNFCVGDRKDK